MKPLPPFGREWILDGRRYGPVVCFGPGAWDWARANPNPVLVLPEDRQPWDFTWPIAGRSVLVHELGCIDTARLERLAQALLLADAELVVAIRHSQLPGYPPRRLGVPGPVYSRDARPHVAA